MIAGTTRKAALMGAGAACLMGVTPAHAQETVPAEKTGEAAPAMDEIVVTARRVKEDVQRVPITITTLGADKLARSDLHDLSTATRELPGLSIFGAAGTTNPATTAARGVLGVVTYFANVPAPSSGFSTLFDVESLQFLKGPQGTLFGLSSNAGALVLEPNKPGNSFGGYVNTTVGSRDRHSIEAAIDLPIARDKILLRLAGQAFYERGWIKDVASGIDHGHREYYTLRPSLIVRPSDQIENYTLFQYSRSNSDLFPYVVSDFNFSPPSQLPALALEAVQNGGSRPAFDSLRDQILAGQLALGPYRINGVSVGCPSTSPPAFPTTPVTSLTAPVVACSLDSFAEDYLLVNSTTLRFGGWTIKNHFGRSWGKTFNAGQDLDGTRLVILETNPRNTAPLKNNTTWSDELQISGTLFGRLDVVAGLFHNDSYNQPQITYTSFLFGPTNRPSISKTDARDSSVYGQGNYRFGGALTGVVLTAGYRYSRDSIEAETSALDPATFAVVGTTGGPNSPAGRAQFSQGSYTFQVLYQAAPGTALFFNNSKGYSSGGLQNVAGYERFLPDSLNNFEGGVKSTFRIGSSVSARINVSAYYGRYENIKVTTQALTHNATTGALTAVAATTNAGRGIVEGIDTDFTLLVGKKISFSGFFAYSKDRYTKFPSLDLVTLSPIDLSNQPFILVPEVKFGIEAAYHLPFDVARLGDISLRANYSRQSSMVQKSRPRVPLDPSNPNSGFICTRQRSLANGYGPLSADGGTAWIDCVPPQQNLDLAINWVDVLGKEGLHASLTVTNVTNEWKGAPSSGDQALGVTIEEVREPRSLILQLGYRF